MRIVKIVVTLILIVITFFNCGRPKTFQVRSFVSRNDPVLREIEADSVLFQWKTPVDSIEIIRYEIFYRIPGKNDQWDSIGTVFSQDENRFFIKRLSLPSGDSIFEIAVRSVAENNAKSEFASSSSMNTIPKEGWYLLWR